MPRRFSHRFPHAGSRISVANMFANPLRNRQGLWDNRDFLRLWGAETISQFGSHITLVAIPLLAALTLGASPFEMGLLTAAGGLPRLLVGLIAGAWVDRLRKRPLMVGTDIGRAIVLLTIPIASMLDMLSFELLFIVTLLVGIQTVFFNASYTAIVLSSSAAISSATRTASSCPASRSRR